MSLVLRIMLAKVVFEFRSAGLTYRSKFLKLVGSGGWSPVSAAQLSIASSIVLIPCVLWNVL